MQIGMQKPKAEGPWMPPSSSIPDGSYWFTSKTWRHQVAVEIKTDRFKRQRQIQFYKDMPSESLQSLPPGSSLMPRLHS